jgi:N4-gp56 family major capsid protein|tara:strand:+ start:357 stop:1316 length:960 start_codon:yes stop_codon:yes gene_type:complete
MAYTGTGDVSSDTAAFQQLAYFAFRSQPMYEMIADVRSTAQTHNGASVQFNIYDNMAQATSALTEASDVTAVALGDSTVVVTLAEYGNAVITTAKLRGTSFLNVDADAANIIGYNMVDSVDKLVSNVANAGTNVIYAQGSMGSRPTSRVGIADAATFGAQEGRQAVAELRTASAPGFDNGNYIGLVHPDVSYDLREQTAVTDVIQYQIRQEGAAVRNGSIGVFGGIEWIENPRAPILDDAGATGTTNVYQTLVAGRQALAKAFSRAPGFGEDPSVVFGPVTDTLRRFHPVGWYHLVGHAIFRQAALQRIESSSSIGDNT